MRDGRDAPARAAGWRDGLLGLACLATAGIAIASYPAARAGSLTPQDAVCAAVAATTALVLGLGATRRRFLLGALAVLATVGHTNVATFHGRIVVHYHDVAHYYLGTKYYDELDHTDLYDAMARAELDMAPPEHPLSRVRSLHSYFVEPVHRSIARGEVVRTRFSPERWSAFVEDTAFFREKLGRSYPDLFQDKGFNATPFWVLVASPVVQAIPAGSRAGIPLLALVDPLLLASTLALVARTFGLEAALLTGTFFGVTFGATYGWIGGGFFRYGWFSCVLGAACAVHRRKARTAGLLLGIAALLRIFPLLVAVPLGLKALAIAVEHRKMPRRQLELLAAFSATCVVGFLATAVLARGFWHWHDWTVHMGEHARNLSSNRIGLAELLTYRSGDLQVTWTEYMKLLDDREGEIRSISLAAVLPALVVVGAAARRSTDVAALALGLPLVWATSIVAGYYYSLAALLVVARRRAGRDLAVLFGAEATAHVAARLVPDPRLAFAWHGGALILVTLWCFRRPLRKAIRRLRGGRLRVPPHG